MKNAPGFFYARNLTNLYKFYRILVIKKNGLLSISKMDLFKNRSDNHL